ncbi:hypothetical protein [Enorma phocaeensis]|uniref:Uncharacterized protein n=1 Tax=Enorma phocaeensis TaxID=1871019 RepID=A0ABT7V900_9ACTN|nr:hypothetical protein [Enorma phocaeensis]MDM8274337.1 hypothetical protein [Enorma phocaeensis]
MPDEKVLYEDAQYRVPTQADIWLNNAIKQLGDSVVEGDFFGAAKAVGVLELLHSPDLEFYTGMAWQAAHDFAKVIECFSKVPPESQYYPLALTSLATAYNVIGDYSHLNELFTQNAGAGYSPIQELHMRLNCLEKLFLGSDIKAAIPTYVQSRPVSSLGNNNEDRTAYYHVCRILSDMLLIAGECINQCGLFRDSVPNSGYDFGEHPETQHFSDMYDRCVYILQYSRFVEFIRFTSDVESLAECALVNRSWKDKIDILRNSNYVSQIAQITYTLCAPEAHPTVPPYECLEGIMERYGHMLPQANDSIIDKYFDVIEAAASTGVPSARHRLAISYFRIEATDEDPHNLRKRIGETIAKDRGEDLDAIRENVRIAERMTRKGYSALLCAEHTYALYSEGRHGVRDASNLALMYFRIFEIEYNVRLIRPFIASLNFSDVARLTDFSEYGRFRTNREYKDWARDLTLINEMKNGQKKSLELGTIRTLLARIHRSPDRCAHLLEEELEKVLTEAGVDAYRNETILDVIGKANVDAYRNPGAHTGFISFSKAQEAREYVFYWLPIVETWFKAAGHGE